MKGVSFLLVTAALLLSACSSDSENEPPQQASAAHAPAREVMGDLAASNCASAVGTLALSRQLDGSSVWICQLSNGRRCGESALMSGICAR